MAGVPVRQAITEAAARLAAAGVASPAYDAEEIAACVMGVERRDLWRIGAIDPRFWSLVARRERREPLQHITGRAYFRHLVVAVGPGVFVPRPETEVVAGAAIDEARRLRRAVVVDLCTGSGAIALAVAQEVPDARVHAVEMDADAHVWAARNCAGSAVDLRRGDMAAAFRDLDGQVDVVVSNPPYIPLDATIRDPEVAAHDPGVALWSGPDGLDAVRVVERVAARLLRPGGLLVVEHADVQGAAVPRLLEQAGGWSAVADHVDLTGRPRYATARWGDRGQDQADEDGER